MPVACNLRRLRPVASEGSDPAHQQGVSQEEQDNLRDGDRGERGQVRQPGAYVEYHPDACGGVERVDERGEIGPECTAHPSRHEVAEHAAGNVDERHEDQLERTGEGAEEVDDHGPNTEGRDDRRVLDDERFESLPDPELHRPIREGRDAQHEVERSDYPRDRDPAGRALSHHRPLLRERTAVFARVARTRPDAVLQEADELGAPGRDHVVLLYLHAMPSYAQARYLILGDAALEQEDAVLVTVA